MKTFTHFSQRIQLFVMLISLGAMSSNAAVHYVRMATDATSWNNMAGASITTSNEVDIISTDTYYFAKGTYTLTSTTLDAQSMIVIGAPALTTGKIYGGFSGNESSIDLATRAIADKDGNGITEPWEFTNETVIQGAAPFNDLTGSNRRLITVTGGEVNGVTFNNHYYFGDTTTPAPSSGAIVLGKVTTYPQLEDDIDENAGKLTFCTVRKVKVGGAGPVMLTNKNSQVDQCLIEECIAMGGEKNLGGGALWLNALGGKVTNSVIRNCESKVSNVGSGKGGAIWANHPSYDFRSNALDCSTLIYNCLIYNNSAGAFGSAVRVEGKNGGKTKAASVINCTILNNYTPATGTGALEMIFDGCLAVNNIVLNASGDELRVRDTRHLVSNSIYGTLVGQTTLNPGNDVLAGKNIKDLNFVKPLYAQGAAGVPGDDFFDRELYDSIRTANFRIASSTSPAVVTPGALTLPATFPSTATDAVPTAVIGAIPASDMLGVSRTTTNTIGAYQYVATSGFNNNRFTNTLSVVTVPNGVLVNNQAGKEIVFYSQSGQLIHKQLLKSNNEIISLQAGFYIVGVDKLKAKVIIK